MRRLAKFNFRLQSYLSLKSKIEDQKRNEFGKAVAALELEKQRLIQLERERDLCIEEFRVKVEKYVDMRNLNQFNLFLERQKDLIKKQHAAIARAEAYVRQKRMELVEAMKDRKILDKLRENEFEEYLDEEKKNEQKVLDDLVSYKYR